MSLRRRVLSAILILVILAAGSLAVALSYDSPCSATDPLPEDAKRMKAIVLRCYGSPEVLRVEEVAKPTPADDEVLVRVRAAAVNPVDWHFMRGSPYVMRLSTGMGAPSDTRMGVDFAGTVEAVGRNVRQFRPGDAVFGGKNGALGEYVTVREARAIVHMPPHLTFEQAASVPVAAITALQGLRDKGRIQPGQKVLINGASGGVGTFAVQIAKAYGAEVTGVCSTRNVDLVRSLGADHVIDYTREDFTLGGQRYDLILDNVANRSLSQYRRVLKDEGALIIVGGARGDWIGPLLPPITAALMSPFVDQKLGMFIARLNKEDLHVLAGLMQTGKVTPVIDRRYTLSETPAAIEYLETGRARGKVIVALE